MAELRNVNHGFPPVADKDCTMLFLGSIPSVESHNRGFYYMHPQNRFWKILSALFNENFDADIQKKTELLLKHHIALYDSIESCSIYGSSDSKIYNVIPADIEKIIKDTKISKIYLVGARSATEFKKANPNLINLAAELPSPSPANAAFSLEKLIEVWREKIFK